MSTKNKPQQMEEAPKVKVQSVFVPENWKKNQEYKRYGFLNWMAYHIKSKHYTNDQDMSNALLKLN